MSERPVGSRRRSRRDSLDPSGHGSGSSSSAASQQHHQSGSSRERRSGSGHHRKPIKEPRTRWLLTRKTWRYMADAGRRLIPDSVAGGSGSSSNKCEASDIPKIEQYFNEVCARESKFLLWRKSSYPGSLAFRSARRQQRRHKKGGSCRTKLSSSADEGDSSASVTSVVSLQGPVAVASTSASQGKSQQQKPLDLAKVKREWLLASPPKQQQQQQQKEQQREQQEEEDTKALADMLQKYLNMQSASERSSLATNTTNTTTNADTTWSEGSAKSGMTTTTATTTAATTSASTTRSVSMTGGSGGFAKEPVFSASAAAATAAAAVANSSGSSSTLDYQKLIEKLEQHLNQIMAEGRRNEATRPSSSSGGVGLVSGGAGSSITSGSGAIPKITMPYQSDFVHKSLLETLSRYYSKSPNREHVISDILTDRKLLEKLYFDLRCTRGFRGPRATGAYTSPTARWWNQPTTQQQQHQQQQSRGGRIDPRSKNNLSTSPPPLIAVQGPSTERGPIDSGIQTDPVTQNSIESWLIEREKDEQQQQSSPPPQTSSKEQHHKFSGRRRSSVDNDDVSPSVSDTIKRYLRMARKKSIDADKADRFKRVNYDRNLRNIKPKGDLGARLSDDEGNSKGCQTEDNWACGYREMRSLEPGETAFFFQSDNETTTSPVSRNASSRSSIDAGHGCSQDEAQLPSTPKHHQSFLSHLLHGTSQQQQQHQGKEKPHSAPGSPALAASSSSSSCSGVLLGGGGTAMQKSKSSSSVVHHGSRLVAKKIWKSRSKSSSRAVNLVSTWTPQGKCTWAGTNGRRVTLQDTPLRSLAEVERKVLCRVAVAKLQALNLGVHIRPPTESLASGTVTAKPKRRAYLLKRKALTTGFFTDSKSKEEKEKESSGGLVFGISLAQCLENDRLARIASGEIVDVGCLSRNSRHGSRTSFTSLIETTTTSKTDEGGSCESLSSKGGGSGGALTSSDSGVLNELSDPGPPAEHEAVPSIVRNCIRHLEAKGLHTLGIFRVSPSKKRVRQLREDWDCGRETKIGPDQCPHDVAALLKEYFRDLPDALLCRDLYQAFVHTQKIRNRRLQQEALQHLIQLLPTPNRETLYALLNFLSEVAANSEDRKSEVDGELLPGNKMDTTNLATVFAPNILHCVKPGQQRSELSAERAEERIDVINVVRALLEHVNELFIVPAALLDELYLHMMDSHPAELDVALSRRVVEEPTNADDVELCSENENYSVDDNQSPSGTTTAATSPTSTVAPVTIATSNSNNASPATIGGRKLYSREECLHQTAGVGGDIGPKPRHRPKRPTTRRKDESSSNTRSNSLDSGSSEEPVDSRYRPASSAASTTSSSPMVITASLTIPMSGAFTLNLDDPDIPYIEDQSTNQQLQSRHVQQQSQQQQQPNAPPRRQRQRSVSGSEGGGGRHGSDSAVGSSATLSGDQAPSSPTSWASTPPTSPDSAVTAVSYIPDQPQLQRVSFTTSSEITRQQMARSANQQQQQQQQQDVTATVPQSPVHTPSITSIGGAVMRSKTADIERMLQIGRTEHHYQPTQTSTKQQQQQQQPSSLIDSKKYTKRRYTDSRHQTRHIPDADSLANSGSSSSIPSPSSLASRLTSALHQRTSSSSHALASSLGTTSTTTGSTSTTTSSSASQQPVWKRRELISSAPKERGSFF